MGRRFLRGLWLWIGLLGATGSFAQSDVVITGFTPNGLLTCTNLTLNSTCRVEWAASAAGPWSSSWSNLTGIVVGSNRLFSVAVPMFYRVVMTPPPPPITNTFTVVWGRFQWPQFALQCTTSTITTTYGRVYIPGLTDRGPSIDPALSVVVQMGYGPTNSAPANNTNWVWTTAGPNPFWNGTSAGEVNNDEYQANLTIPTAGTYHAVYRFSGNFGQTWLYAGNSGSTSANGTSPLADALLVVVSP